jgi:hypothetical protein
MLVPPGCLDLSSRGANDCIYDPVSLSRQAGR